MIQLAVVDYIEDNQDDVETGTCDLCMGSTDIRSADWVFRDNVTGETKSFDSQVWDWGDVYTMPQCYNIPAFSQWLSTSTKAAEILASNRIETLDMLDRYVVEELLEASGYIQEDH